ncbi:MAG TPA: carbohydrate ABC transporter substrate-binding protein [Candidatus Lambdaproteobacteria bacterium]|jgi:glucose/mannose transport system substrate-binding protein|nr:sugar ABC transporter substrate-binding protein [Deltaproteobacteria bacterium]HIB44648.1 carbohydrate ABC transporter substrate-binding protein [Candidatus Lambdaproteobacteria bacterium]HIN48684.1 carbohydrate ABC transporter substrate-binding protein [Deltaproteobacteria bacterium]HIO10676.1 carbohydrate ABC transporter substrate-binding protein [Deltaproteobacteria bacterium]HIO83273.1 carbohydrate ABC transporter substrate-binding protein [Deltaproteobacteria bacterium]
MYKNILKLSAGLLLAAGMTAGPAMAGGEAEVLHWWTSGGEAKALKVLKDDFAKNGGTWKDMPVAGGGGDAAMVTLKARIVSGDPPTAAQIKGPTIQEYDDEGVVGPYNIHAVASAENWDALLSPQVANHMKCDGFTKYCAAPVNIHRIDWFWANKKVLDANGLKMPTSWDEFNAAAKKLKAAGIIPLAHGGQPWQDATVFEAVALGIGGNEFYQKAIVDLDMNALGSSTMVKVFDQMRILQGFTDEGMPGRDWNVATGMVMNGKAAFQIMGDWAKGEFANAGLKPGEDYYCLPTPSNHGYLYNVDSFIFFSVKGKNKIEGQKLLASLMMGKNFQKVFNLYKGSIPARLDVPMDEFDLCAKGSAADLNYSAMTGGLLPSFAHGMALKLAQKGAIQDVVTEHFNSDMSSQEAASRLVRAVKDSL